uniref:Carboxylic ester hydrolase n=1 Tax=Stomoxys calcitrans TaxID=35570 RepID=A0A1I8NSN8_STOCA
MNFARIILSAFLLTAIEKCVAAESLTVDTALGIIKGIRMETRLGNKFWSFRGIRYAEAPVGELRFQNPQPVRPWQPNIFDATQDGPICPQVTSNRTRLSEDCLRLNVYTKSIGGQSKNLKPVLVYLHPGGFSFSSAISDYAGPQYLMDRDVVLVTLNYRLATLGFLATGTEDAPGNMAFKDQVIALRWVQAHIEKFGGDPKSVTLWGYSAGSISVGLHILSPMSKGLFHRAIMQSGTPLAQFRYANHQMVLAQRQAKLLKCPIEPVKDMVKCLKNKPMLDFVDTTEAMFDLEWVPGLNWMPVVETSGSQERFLVEDPYKTMLEGNINKVPLIAGVTEYEFYNSGYYTLQNKTQRERFNQDFAKYLAIYFFYERDTPKSRFIGQQMRSYYLQNQTLEFPQSLVGFAKLFTDLMVFQYHRYVEMVSQHIPVYTYLFTYKGRYSHFRDPVTNQTYGAMHHDELWYLFYVPQATPLFSITDPENKVIERLTRLWQEFAIKGDPNNPLDPFLKNLQWPLYDSSKKAYLEIGNELKIKQHGIYPKRMELWDCLFPVQEIRNTNL